MANQKQADNRNPQSTQNNPAKQAPGANQKVGQGQQGQDNPQKSGDQSKPHGNTGAKPENPADLGHDPELPATEATARSQSR